MNLYFRYKKDNEFINNYCEFYKIHIHTFIKINLSDFSLYNSIMSEDYLSLKSITRKYKLYKLLNNKTNNIDSKFLEFYLSNIEDIIILRGFTESKNKYDYEHN